MLICIGQDLASLPGELRGAKSSVGSVVRGEPAVADHGSDGAVERGAVHLQFFSDSGQRLFAAALDYAENGELSDIDASLRDLGVVESA